MAKISEEFLAALREAAAEGLHMSAIARKLNVTPSKVQYTIDTHRIVVTRNPRSRGRVINAERPASANPISPLRELAVAEFNSGDSAAIVAKRLGVTRNAVLGQWQRAGLMKSRADVKAPLQRAEAPPSLAMIRLAQHDPIIMRALRQRRGEHVDFPDPRYHKQDPLTQKRGGA